LRYGVEDVARRAFLRSGGAAVGLGLTSGLTSGVTSGLMRPGGELSGNPDQLFQVGQFAAADRGYAAELRRDPQDAHAWAQRGYIALLANRFGDAARFLGTAIRLAPADRLSMLRLADCYVRQDDYARAVPLLRAAGDPVGATLYGVVRGTPYQLAGARHARLPFRTLDPLPSVEAAVNGTSAVFTLDTGATFTFSAALARAAGVRALATVMVDHGSGPVTSYAGVVDELRLGGIELRNIPVLWDDTSPEIIGTTIFYHLRTTMDYEGRALALSVPGAAPRRTADAATAPLWLAPDHFVFSSGTVGHAGAGPVLIDTGGVGLGVVLNPAQAASAGVAPDYTRPHTDFGVTVYPCTAGVAIGRTPRRNVPGVVGPIPSPAEFGFGSLATISHEYFKPLSVTFDFTSMTLKLRLRGLAGWAAEEAESQTAVRRHPRVPGVTRLRHPVRYEEYNQYAIG
jgi:hypothetical protein